MINHINEKMVVSAVGATDVGMKRRLNEDVFRVAPDIGAFLVADGMGGHAAGEVASALAADEIVDVYGARALQSDQTWPEHWNMAQSSTANVLSDSVLAGHRKVTDAVSSDPDLLKGMGTTVVAAALPPESDRIVICHVGDSRAYLWRDNDLKVLTNDHSWVHEQVMAGSLTEEAAREHPLKNVVTQALGGSVEPTVDVFEDEMNDSDIYLLCSDGLNSMLTDDEIADVMGRTTNLEDLAGLLIVAANKAGGNDNVTVVLMRAEVQKI